ncbi:MAG: M1 family metallopeptidase [Myxococcota bacterium]
MARLDPHSYNDSTQPETASLSLNARVDFGTHTLEADARLTFRAPSLGPVRLDLDTRELSVHEVLDDAGRRLPFTLHPPEPALGARLSIELPSGVGGVRVRYRTAPTASALQWLAPSQTLGGQLPFLFSQCQAIHARSVVPLQDTPRIRIRYRAELDVPAQLRAVMAAAFIERREEQGRAVEVFEMPQAIPPYLFAFAVGDLARRDLSPRSCVWAEPKMLDRAATEFSGVEEMIRAAEALFGPYDWDRFDILTMPPSFPYGGMENPRLTFLTPTIVTGDRSLVNVLAHELAHSWTGNLVTNANAEHFWLNEGFTVYAERRILEALEGPDVAALHAAIGRRSLDEAVARFAKTPQLTRLRTQLAHVDPDEAFSQVPYEKGYLFLRALEEAVGRTRFDAFLKKYLATFRFESVTTEDFLHLARQHLDGALEKLNAGVWIDGEGVPENAPRPSSKRLEQIDKLRGAVPKVSLTQGWTPTEWQLYLDSMPRPAPQEICQTLDTRYRLTESQNHEVLMSWLTLATTSDYAPVLPRVQEVLGQVGRMKYLRPLYLALAKNRKTKALARQCYEQTKAGYHPIARQVVEGVLREAGA